jgi:hypothetical protein
MTRFGTLRFLCGLQVLIGTLLIIGAIVGLLGSFVVLPKQVAGFELIAVGIAIGVIFVGLQVIAMAQVYQCLMQIEINTRPAETEPAAAPRVIAGASACPKCGSGKIEIYEESRDGVGWVCRSCNHAWLVSHEQALEMQKSKLVGQL